MGSLLNYPLVKLTDNCSHLYCHVIYLMMCFLLTVQSCSRCQSVVVIFFSQRTAGSSSDGTEDSDFSADLEHTEAPESVHRRSTRLTRASLRLSRSSQGKGLI